MTQIQQQNIPQGAENLFEYDGHTETIFGICVINLLLGIITLGIYKFDY